MAQSAVYRVCGSKLYKGESEVGDVAGSGRVSMAHGRTSQAVGVNGQLPELTAKRRLLIPMRLSAIRQQVLRLYTSSAPVRYHQSPARALR